MRLEIISKAPRQKTHETPLLFLHGAWHAAWCWENFLPYFAEQGYETHALSLRGHGNSEGRERIRWFSARDYVADLAQTVDSLGTPPVLIAHSMGGYITQKYLESYTLPAAVLLSSLPTVGILGMILRRLRKYPVSTLKALFLVNTWYFVSTPAIAKDALFSDDFPDELFLEYYSRIQTESYRLALDATFLNLPQPRRVHTPLLLLSAERDRLFTIKEQQKTARAYKTEAMIYPKMAHDMMLERGWETVANQILNWLQLRNL